MIVLIMKMKLAERLKHTRELNKISMRKLADEVGVSVSNISFYESGKSVPSAEIVFNIARYFNVTSDYLLGLSDKPYGDTPDSILNELEELKARNSVLEIVTQALKETFKKLENDEKLNF